MQCKCVAVQALDSFKVWGLFLVLMTENLLQNQNYKMQRNRMNSPESAKQKQFLCEKYKPPVIKYGVLIVRANHGNVNISCSAISSQTPSKFIGPLMLKVGIDSHLILPK